MKRQTLASLAATSILLLLNSCERRPSAPPPEAEATVESIPKAAVIDQPASIPGDWEWQPVSLPPLEGVIAQPYSGRPVYGLYCWENEYIEFREQIRKIGWRSLRLSGPIHDEVFKMFVEDDIQVMFTMPAREPYRSPQFPQGKWRNRADFPTDEAFLEAYLGDITKVLNRYGPDGTFFKDHPELPKRPLEHIEIFNEPNFWYLDTGRNDTANHYPPKDAAARNAQNLSRQKLYAKMLVAAHAHVKKGWPGVKTVGFAAGGAMSADVPFIRGVHQADPAVAKSYDILSTHPYTRPAAPELLHVRSFGKFSIITGWNQIHDIMKQHGSAAKPIWWTELNWTINPETGGGYSNEQTDPRGRGRDIPPDLQAAYLVRAYALAMRLGVQRTFYMSLIDTDGVNSGMFNKDRSWRPSANAIARMIQLMPNPKLLEAPIDGKDGVFAYRFKSDIDDADSAEVLMIWKAQGPATVENPWSQRPVELIDTYGKTVTPEGVNGPVCVESLEIGPMPVYLRAAR